MLKISIWWCHQVIFFLRLVCVSYGLHSHCPPPRQAFKGKPWGQNVSANYYVVIYWGSEINDLDITRLRETWACWSPRKSWLDFHGVRAFASSRTVLESLSHVNVHFPKMWHKCSLFLKWVCWTHLMPSLHVLAKPLPNFMVSSLSFPLGTWTD